MSQPQPVAMPQPMAMPQPTMIQQPGMSITPEFTAPQTQPGFNPQDPGYLSWLSRSGLAGSQGKPLGMMGLAPVSQGRMMSAPGAMISAPGRVAMR
jgi:hypothetical protein